jgi:tRNA nucleotidyltransferase (CCA-adding enzyme)
MLRLVALFAELPPKEAERTARALRFSNQQIAWIRGVLEHANTIQSATSADASPTAAAVRRWIARAGRTRIASVMRLVSARFAAERQAGFRVPSHTALTALYRRVLRSAFRDPVELSDLAVDGDALRSIGIAEGPEIGWVLHRLLDVVLENPLQNTVENLLRLAGELLQRYRNGER